MQNPSYKDVTLNAYIHLTWPQHKQIKSIIIEQRVGVLSSSARDRIRTLTCEFMDKTPQVAEEQLVMTMDKAQETELQRYKN